ncbi:MAG: response regulator transcription factor [Balneolales bacterium]|nr:response regulator transcription factor [Balneolales bacterium]
MELCIGMKSGHTMKVMIVEDHADMRKILKAVVIGMTTGGVEIIECESGEEAVLNYEIYHPDCVLMDIQLKSMNGFEATKKICEQDEQAKIIFVSSHDTLQFRKKAEALHAFGFVSKDRLSDITPLFQSIRNTNLS